MNLNDFTSRFNGGARKSLFEVIIAGPDMKDTSFMVKASKIPASKIGFATVNYMGREVFKPGDREFEDWTVTLYNDEGFVLRSLFESWSSGLNGHSSNTKTDGSYKTAVALVNQYSTSGSIIHSYNMYNIWPKTVGEISLGWEDNDKIEEYEVTFSCDYWTWAS
jgi:hypothetical protein